MNRESLRQYTIALIVTAVLATSLGWYLTARRGYFDLSLLNKSLASTTLTLLGIVLLLGPLSRVYNAFDRWINYRKELGVFAFFTGAVHVYLSMFPLAKGGPFSLFRAKPLTASLGLIGLLLMFFLFLSSFEKIKNRLGVARWWKIQYTGVRFAAIALLLHMILLKYPEWSLWLAGDTGKLANPSFPPASLLVGVFSAFVLLVRLSELLGQRLAKVLIPTWLVLSLGSGVWLFIR